MSVPQAEAEPVCTALRVPAGSRLQKIHNVKVREGLRDAPHRCNCWVWQRTRSEVRLGLRLLGQASLGGKARTGWEESLRSTFGDLSHLHRRWLWRPSSVKASGRWPGM